MDAITVKNLSKKFRLPHEKHSSLKQAVLNFHRRSYEQLEVLDDINFSVKQGEFFGIVGRNGSGKSTLLKLLAGIYAPTSGGVQIHGQLTPFIELGVGFNPELTGRDNVYLNGTIFGMSRKQINDKYDEIVAFAELEKFMDQKLKNYSSGMQVRLAFSIAIRARTEILLLDEVLAVGDASFQQKCYTYFEELKRENKTVVFVSHDMNAIRRFCTRAIYVKNGRLTHQGSPTEIADNYALENIENTQQIGESGGKENSPMYKINSRIIKQDQQSLNLQVNFESKTKEDLYIGMSVLRDGLSVGEITTPPTMKLSGSGKITFTLDTAVFNGGTYQIAVALFKSQNRQLIAIGSKDVDFVVKGSDITKGSALKLADTWEEG